MISKLKPWKDNNGVAWPKCPQCGSEDVYYENRRTGIGKYTCCDCGHVLSKEQAKVFDEWEKKCGSVQESKGNTVPT